MFAQSPQPSPRRKTKHKGKEQAQPKHTALFPLMTYCPNPASHVCVLRRPGGYGGAAAPDPIPNSAVKRSSANGTSSQDAGE